MLDLKGFNSTLEVEAQKQIITFEEFKALHKGKRTEKNNLTYNAVIASISNVSVKGNGYEITFDTNKKLTITFNGMFIVEDIHGISYGGINNFNNLNSRNLDKGHLRVNIESQSFILEKLIGIAECILKDELPDTFDGLTVNVMDGSGNIYTAQEIGISPDFNLNNLEWTLNSDNLVAGRKIKQLLKKTGNVYRFSANDQTFRQLYQTKDNEKIKEYCEANFTRVR